METLPVEPLIPRKGLVITFELFVIKKSLGFVATRNLPRYQFPNVVVVVVPFGFPARTNVLPVVIEFGVRCNEKLFTADILLNPFVKTFEPIDACVMTELPCEV